MNVEETVAEIRAKGKPGSAKIYARHGVTEETVGLSYADLGKLVKRIGQDHALALGLWKTKLHDARVLACKIADPDKITKMQLEAWQGACSNYVISDAVCSLVARSPHGATLAAEWSKQKTEWKCSAGFNVYSILAGDGKLDEKVARSLIAQIQKRVHLAPNRARHSMNNTLISIAGYMPALREPGIAAAKAIGDVEVDHGQTGCKTPNALDYIEKMLAHQAKRAPKKAPKKASV